MTLRLVATFYKSYQFLYPHDSLSLAELAVVADYKEILPAVTRRHSEGAASEHGRRRADRNKLDRHSCHREA